MNTAGRFPPLYKEGWIFLNFLFAPLCAFNSKEYSVQEQNISFQSKPLMAREENHFNINASPAKD